MKIISTIRNSKHLNIVALSTNGNERTLDIPAKPDGFGSAVNGGELLFLSLATCACNDIYREAARRGLTIDAVDVQVTGDFGAEGEPAQNITYSVDIKSQTSTHDELAELIKYVDRIAEVHNTVRKGTEVKLTERGSHT